MAQMTRPDRRDCWASFVSVRPRYQRSVHVERDAGDASWLSGYIPTPLVRFTTRRIADGLRTDGTARAWSITGPYGSGKSAFALFLSQVLGPTSTNGLVARTFLHKSDELCHQALFGGESVLSATGGLWPVVATADRRSLNTILIEALERSAKAFWAGKRGKPHQVQRLITEAAVEARSGRELPTKEVVELYEDFAENVAASNRDGNGLLVILDEAGKTLEHASSSGSAYDVQVLQELAEAASRSKSRPIVFTVLLHQAFEHYASRVNAVQRNDWAKVQGRFQDVIFQESPDELLRLIGAALDRGALPLQVEDAVKKAAIDTAKQVSLPGIKDAKLLRSLLMETAPLHPTTALCLGPLFRSGFSQNERSLFAFLASSEPFGFNAFLQDEAVLDDDCPLYRLDHLYDYLVKTFGGRLFGRNGKAWSQAETALRRLPANSEALDARLIKSIGILNALGDATGLRASEGVLCAAVGLAGRGGAARVSEGLERLRAGSLVVYRKYKDAYQLWEGSDFDLDQLTEDALDRIDRKRSLVQRLTRTAPPRPIVARRHFFKTGTLRHFGLAYVDESALDAEAFSPPVEGDGTVWLLVPSSGAAGVEVRGRLSDPDWWTSRVDASTKPVIVGMPTDAQRLRELAAEMAALEFVQTHTTELDGDPVARRELQSRLVETERQIRSEVARALKGGAAADWYYNGTLVEVNGSRDMARALSQICDQVYVQAPHLHNELLNRSQLSSSAASARRILLQAMIEHGSKPQLGIEGHPPELSMYRSLLEFHRLHRKGEDAYRFAKPKKKRAGSLVPAYREARRLLTESDGARVPVARLYEVWQQPPFGLKAGPLPVLFTVLLMEFDAEIALYENGAFVARLDAPMVERLLRSPDKFEVQYVEMAGARTAFLSSLGKTGNTRSGLLGIVRELVRFVKGLPDYSLYTKRVSKETQAVRHAIERAKEPARLIFTEIPRGLGLEPLSSKDHGASESAGKVLAQVRASLNELAQAYPRLLDEVEASLQRAFDLPADPVRARAALSALATNLLPVASDHSLKGLLIRLADTKLQRMEWLVSVATQLAGKPPVAWRDPDVEYLGVELSMVARRCRTLEALTLAHAGGGAVKGDPVRLSVTRAGKDEVARVVVVGKEQERRVGVLASQVLGLLEKGASRHSRSEVLAALARVSEQLLDDESVGGKPEARDE